MKYVNRITGAVIESTCEISGGGWEPMREQPPSGEPAKPAPRKRTTRPANPAIPAKEG